MKANITSISGSKFSMAGQTIGMLKQSLSSSSGIPPCQQSLLFLGEPVDDSVSINDLGYNPQLIFVPLLEGGNQIFLQSLSGETITIDITKSTTVQEVKQKIEKKINVAASGLKLIYMGRILDNDKTMDDYNIKPQTTIKFIPVLKG